MANFVRYRSRSTCGSCIMSWPYANLAKEVGNIYILFDKPCYFFFLTEAVRWLKKRQKNETNQKKSHQQKQKLRQQEQQQKHILDKMSSLRKLSKGGYQCRDYIVYMCRILNSLRHSISL